MHNTLWEHSELLCISREPAVVSLAGTTLMDEELNKLRAENPEGYRRQMASRNIATALVWLVALPLTIGISWPLLKHATWGNALNLFGVVGTIFLFFVFVALKVTGWITVKLFGDIARVEGEERVRDYRARTRAKYDSEDYQQWSAHWQEFMFRVGSFGAVASILAIVAIDGLGLPRSEVTVTTFGIAMISPWFSFNRDLVYYRTACLLSLVFLFTSVVISNVLSHVLQINEQSVVLAASVIAVILAFYFAEQGRGSS